MLRWNGQDTTDRNRHDAGQARDGHLECEKINHELLSLATSSHRVNRIFYIPLCKCICTVLSRVEVVHGAREIREASERREE
jgi:hypothetical protein